MNIEIPPLHGLTPEAQERLALVAIGAQVAAGKPTTIGVEVEPKKFKVPKPGDKVKVVGNTDRYHSDQNVGKIATVRCAYTCSLPNCADVQFAAGCDIDGNGGWTIPLCDLEPV